MKALSIRQPWAWAILNAGKDIENRDWTPRNPGLRFRGEFLIHASGTMTREEYRDFVDTYEAIECEHPLPRVNFSTARVPIPKFNDLQRGGFVGRARVVDIVRAHTSPWFFGEVGLVLADPKPIPFIPFKGMLGFFDVPAEIERLAA